MPSPFRIGVFITNQNYLDKDMVSALDEQIAMVRMARDHGWDSIFSGQHYLNEGNNQQLQNVPLLSRLAAEAGEMTIGLGVLLLNLHNPVYVAETVATLDVICRGNFVFGVGLGYREVEFDAFAVPKGRRLKRFEECLEVVQRLWAEDEVTFENDVCKLDKVRMNLKPVQRPRPPIWYAANNDNAVLRAARQGDTWFVNPHATQATLSRQMTLYRAELKRIGKPFPSVLPCAKEIFCAKDRKTAIEMAGPYLAGKYQAYAAWGQDKVMPKGESFAQPFERLLEDRFVLGSPEECYDQLQPTLKGMGVNHLLVRTHWAGLPVSSALASMRLISEELLPALRKMPA
jgi:alkanesulfonate monooxygenase SsuD/methylene tetrahydromethanopterin reductase-like flavin-dependent oxidoreductase (luciferase family)